MNGGLLLLERELRRLDRRGLRRRAVRVGLAFVLFVIMVAQRNKGPSGPFLALMLTEVVLVAFLQPVRTAALLVQGRQDGTLPLLGLTPLRTSSVLAGICLASLVLAGEGLLIALPLLSVAAAYGGLDPALLAKALLCVTGTAVLGTAVGAWVGATGERVPSGTFSRALAWMALVCGAPFLAAAVAVREGASEAAVKLVFLPALPLTLPVHSSFAELTAGVAAQVAIAAGLFAWGVRRLDGAILGSEGPAPVSPSERGRREPVPERRVVAWRERVRREPRRWARPGLLVCVAVILCFGGAALANVQRDVHLAYVLATFQNVLLWLSALAWGLLAGARSYVEEREDGTLELLLLTALRPRRIAAEKLLGALVRGRWLIAAGALLHTFCGVAAALVGGADSWALVWVGAGALATVALWVCGVGAALAVGQYCSVLAPTSDRAQTWAATTAGVLFLVGLFVCCPAIAGVAAVSTAAPGVGELVFYGPVAVGCLLVGAGFAAAVRTALPRAAAEAGGGR